MMDDLKKTELKEGTGKESKQQKEANYAIRLQLLDRLKALAENNSDNFGKFYNEFREIQKRWKETNAIPREYADELWRNYQSYCDRVYDVIRIHNQFRDYDYKKNLELKTALCEAAEKLMENPESVSSYHQMQKLYQQWRETGPVVKEQREVIWARFKAVSTLIDQHHREYIQSLEGKEEENQKAKESLCEKLEAIDYAALKTPRDWEQKSKEVLALQEQWRVVGFSPKQSRNTFFKRYRAACNIFFEKKAEYFRLIKGNMAKHVEQKKALCEQAEALKNDTDRQAASEQVIVLRAEWKKIGAVHHKQSEALWKRFCAACDYVFEQKKNTAMQQKSTIAMQQKNTISMQQENTAMQQETESSNLATKKAIIERITRLENTAELKQCMDEWNDTGYVPLQDRDAANGEYRKAVDEAIERLKVDKLEIRLQFFRDNLKSLLEKGDKRKLYNERDKQMLKYERMKSELQTYENNIGFFSASKGVSSLLQETERKIKWLKEEMAIIAKQVEVIDANLS